MASLDTSGASPRADSANIPEVQAIQIEAESVKQNVTVLHNDVDKQSAKNKMR